MTIMEAIGQIDEIKPNAHTLESKVRWLSSLDGLVKRKIIDRYEGDDKTAFEGYPLDVDTSTPLLIPYPYDVVYIRWLEAQIDYANGEYKRYNNSVIAFNAALQDYERHYNITHKHKSAGGFKF